MDNPATPRPQAFATTRWSLVVAATPDRVGASAAQAALETLCEAYWYPLYAFVRFRGYTPDEAQDLTQSFFVRVIEKRGFPSADPERGRFRSYLLGAMKHFLVNEWHRGRAQKRGGGVTFLHLDALDPEARRALEPAASADPDAGFDREWAQETTARARRKLRAEWEARGRRDVFEGLQACLRGDEPSRRETAAQLRMTEGAVKTAVHRLRKRYGELLRAEIAETVADPAEIDMEMRHLVAALRREV